MVYSATTIRDNSKVALKVFKKGPTYDGAVQREQYILDIFNDPKHNIGMFDFVHIFISSKMLSLVTDRVQIETLTGWWFRKCRR